jgi:hypothetical protein
MRQGVKSVPRGKGGAEADYVGGLELDDPAATGADHVVVGVLAVGVLVVDLLVTEMSLADDPAIDQQLQRAINRRLAHPPGRLAHVQQKLLGLEMLVIPHDRFEQQPPLGGILEPALAEILAKDAFGGIDHLLADGSCHDGAQRPPGTTSVPEAEHPGAGRDSRTREISRISEGEHIM